MSLGRTLSRESKRATGSVTPKVGAILSDPLANLRSDGSKVSSGFKTMQGNDPKNNRNQPGPQAPAPAQVPAQIQKPQPTQQQLEQSLIDSYRKDRTDGMAAGTVMGEKYFGGGRDAAGLQKMTGGLLDQYQAGAQNGLSDPAFSAMRNQALGGIQQQTSQGMYDLNAQQGASGVRGAAAQAGKMRVLDAGTQARGNLETNLAVQDIGFRERSMASLGDMLNGERAGQLGAVMGMGNMYAQDRVNAGQSILGDKLMAQSEADLGAANQPIPDTYLEGVMKKAGKPDGSMSVGGNKVNTSAVYATNPYVAAGNYVYNTFGGK